MTKRSATTPVPRSSTHVQAQIREFANSSSPHDVSKQRAVLLLDDKNILSDVVGLGPEDQTKFLDKVDQVSQGICPSGSFIHYFFQVISYP